MILRTLVSGISMYSSPFSPGCRGFNQVLGGDLTKGRLTLREEPRSPSSPSTFLWASGVSLFPFLISSCISRSMTLPPGPLPRIPSSMTRFHRPIVLPVGKWLPFLHQFTFRQGSVAFSGNSLIQIPLQESGERSGSPEDSEATG